MRLFGYTINVFRDIPNPGYPESSRVRIELGKWWEISITRELAERVFDDNYPIIPTVKYSPQVFKDKVFVRLIKNGDIVPFWYGYAYYDFERDCGAFAPVPINFLLAGARWLAWKWWGFKQMPHRFNTTQEAYGRGRRDGFNEGLTVAALRKELPE